MKAEEYILDLKTAVNRLSLTYGAPAFLDALVYPENGYGNMQHEEIREILDLIAQLNRRVNELVEDCGENLPTGQNCSTPALSDSQQIELA